LSIIAGTSLPAAQLSALKEFPMRIIFVILIASVLSILALKYMDSSIGGAQIIASPTDLSAKS
jgi:hypothetical protein